MRFATPKPRTVKVPGLEVSGHQLTIELRVRPCVRGPALEVLRAQGLSFGDIAELQTQPTAASHLAVLALAKHSTLEVLSVTDETGKAVALEGEPASWPDLLLDNLRDLPLAVWLEAHRLAQELLDERGN